jgi:hypothetical protein
MANYRLLSLILVIGALATGCIELRAALQGALDGTGRDGAPINDSGDEPPDDDAVGDVPAVMLIVSNPTPVINEEVLLSCLVTNDVSGPVSFDFQPASGRLFIDPQRGTASFFVEQSDLGATFVFTCTATNENGTSPLSNEQIVSPT